MFVSVCNKEYLIGLEVLLKSLVDNNPRVITEKIPFLIISNELKQSDLLFAASIYPTLILKGFDPSKYAEIDELKKIQRAHGDYTKYEVFSLEADKIIFFDSDLVILGNIDHLIDCKEDFAAVRDLYIDQYNTGVMVIGKKYLNSGVTNNLIELTKIYGITEHLDQDIINYYITDFTEISLSYNFLKIYHKQLFINSGLPKHVKILHYVVKKPWQQREPVLLEQGTLWLERYWFDYYAKVLNLKMLHKPNDLSNDLLNDLML
jgi:lipopolysaccharide biosynthesis glycosyltransferase